MSRVRTASPYLLASLLAATGTVHFLNPGFYDALIPPFLPAPRAWIYASGVLELACAAAVAVPAARRRGALASAALFVAVFPGNLYMAIEPGEVPRWLALARLPLQVPLVLWALQVAGKFPSTARRR
ncbi:MAG: DoxX family protein [Mycobacteriales bacterium]